jgi:transcriptional regulator of NAD metabolism
MDGEGRRRKIAQMIRASKVPITGGELSSLLGVTRQVVVQDVAVLRAGGMPIIATPSGYMIPDAVVRGRALKVFTCRHETLEQARTELEIMVENGGRVRDVIIEHPIYGGNHRPADDQHHGRGGRAHRPPWTQGLGHAHLHHRRRAYAYR